MAVRLNDPIRLADGTVTTIADLAAAGRIRWATGTHTGPKRNGERKPVTHYHAELIEDRTDGITTFWPVSEVAYRTRTGRGGRADMTAVALPPNRTYKHREAEYSPVRPGLGVVEVRESSGPGRKVRVSRYCAREVRAEDGFRDFVLTKPGGTVAYHTSVMPHRRTGVEDRCDCDGFLSQGVCKHTLALRGVIDAGLLPRVPAEET